MSGSSDAAVFAAHWEARQQQLASHSRSLWRSGVHTRRARSCSSRLCSSKCREAGRCGAEQGTSHFGSGAWQRRSAADFFARCVHRHPRGPTRALRATEPPLFIPCHMSSLSARRARRRGGRPRKRSHADKSGQVLACRHDAWQRQRWPCSGQRRAGSPWPAELLCLRQQEAARGHRVRRLHAPHVRQLCAAV